LIALRYSLYYKYQQRHHSSDDQGDSAMGTVRKLATSPKSQTQITKTHPCLLFVTLVLLFYFPAIASIAAGPALPKEITALYFSR
jgi:hypothetical protein